MNGRWWSLLWVPIGWGLNGGIWLFTRDWEPLFLWLGQAWFAVVRLAARIEWLLHVLGRIAVNLLLAVGLFVLYYQAMTVSGYAQPALTPYAETLLRIFDNKVIWAVSLVFAATLGILHLWRLEIDWRRYAEEQQDRLREEDERRAKIRKAGPALPPMPYPPQPRRPNRGDGED